MYLTLYRIDEVSPVLNLSHFHLVFGQGGDYMRTYLACVCRANFIGDENDRVLGGIRRISARLP